MGMVTWIVIAGLALYVFLMVNTIVSVLLNHHEPLRAIAWIVVIWAFPVIGLLCYYVLGSNLRRRWNLNRKTVDSLTHEVVTQYVAQTGQLPIDHHKKQLLHFCKLHCKALPFSGNSADFFTRGNDCFDALVSDIRQARHHIHLEYYIFEDDAIGNTIAAELIAASERGVPVRVIYDDVGCWTVRNSFFDRMRHAGIAVRAFLPVRYPRATPHVNYRNHRKLAIIDGHVGYIGGMNIAQRYVDGQQGGDWLDMHMRISGRGVYGMQLVFLTDWYMTTQQIVNQPAYYPACSDTPATAGRGLMQIVTSAPFARWPNILYAYNKAILSARCSVLIQSPYFTPPTSLLEAIQTAAMSGVHVCIMLPEDPGGWWLRWANEGFFTGVLRAGAEIWLYGKGMMHGKTLIVDDDFCSIGSANIDSRSMFDTFEGTAFIYDPEMVARAKTLFMQTRDSACRRLDFAAWNRRPKRHRLLEGAARIFSPMF